MVRAVLAIAFMSVHPSVCCPSHAGIVSKRINESNLQGQRRREVECRQLEVRTTQHKVADRDQTRASGNTA